MRAQNSKRGAGDNQFGVKLGDIRTLADKIKTNHELALSLWKTGNIDAQFLAILLIKVSLLSADELEPMVKSVTFARSADWLHSYVVKEHADKESLRKKWMTSDDPDSPAGWQLTAGRWPRARKDSTSKRCSIASRRRWCAAAPPVQWTMNMCLAEIGIHFPKHRKRAIAIGEKLGIYRDYPVSKGCTSPFAPIWINAIVSRQT